MCRAGASCMAGCAHLQRCPHAQRARWDDWVPLEDALLPLGPGPAKTGLVEAVHALLTVCDCARKREAAHADARAGHGEGDPHAKPARVNLAAHLRLRQPEHGESLLRWRRRARMVHAGIAAAASLPDEGGTRRRHWQCHG